MKRNIGTLDRIIRVIIALVIFYFAYQARSWWGLVGLFPLLTAIVGFCPGYYLLGISTYKKKVKLPEDK